MREVKAKEHGSDSRIFVLIVYGRRELEWCVPRKYNLMPLDSTSFAAALAGDRDGE